MTPKRIAELRRELRLERISYGELCEIETAAEEAGINLASLYEQGATAADILDELERAAIDAAYVRDWLEAEDYP